LIGCLFVVLGVAREVHDHLGPVDGRGDALAGEQVPGHAPGTRVPAQDADLVASGGQARYDEPAERSGTTRY
jgi:hypothetical protein